MISIMPGVHTFYDGSQLLKPMAEASGLELDKINFVVSMMACIPIGYFYRKHLLCGTASREVRSSVALAVGMCLLFFCFGWAVRHLLANALISYAIMHLVPVKHVHLAVFVFSMGHLLWIHTYRWLLISSYVIDVTGPMMVAVQKITTLAFNFHDGRGRKKADLSKNQLKESIRQIPSLMDYLSYLLNFQTALTGPTFMYSDYDRYLEGKHAPLENDRQWVPTTIALNKLGQAFAFMVCVVLFGKFTVWDLMTPEYMELPLYSWFLCLYVISVINRANYYFAWTLADAVCNMSGFGYSGLDKDGNEKWELCTNVKPTKFESAQSFKDAIDAWNIHTGYWLRRVAYDRTPKNLRTIATYVLSAVWHGVSVGYYITFATGALFTMAGQTWRRCMRWRFTESVQLKFGYDIFSFLVTKAAMAYGTFSFVTMDLAPAVVMYRHLYFIGHFIGFAVLFLLPKYFSPKRSPTSTGERTVVDSARSIYARTPRRVVSESQFEDRTQLSKSPVSSPETTVNPEDLTQMSTRSTVAAQSLQESKKNL